MKLPDIRPYRAADETAVRRICFATAFYGQSMQPYFDDLQLATEALLGYHLRYERESCWVAETGHGVVGYLAGCVDTRRFERYYARRMVPRLIFYFVARGHWRRPAVWKMLAAGARHARAGRRPHERVLARFPAHLHINLDEGGRRMGVGTALLNRFISRLQQAGVVGVHISSATEEGKAFFSRAGFQVLEKYAAPVVSGRSAGEIWLMGRVLAAGDGKEPATDGRDAHG